MLLASRDNKQVNNKKDIKDYDPKVLYDRPRKHPKFYRQSEIDKAALKAINSINARGVYWGNTKTREAKINAFKPLTTLDDTLIAVIGEDFYIMVDKTGKINEFYLPYDNRAEREFREYHNLVLETYEKDKNKKR